MNEYLIVKFGILVGLTENIIISDFKSRLFPVIHQNMDIGSLAAAAAVGEASAAVQRLEAGGRQAGSVGDGRWQSS